MNSFNESLKYIWSLGKVDLNQRTQVNLSELEKIINGKYLDTSRRDFIPASFFVVGLDDLDEENRKTSVADLTDRCNWIGHFNRHNSHNILFFEKGRTFEYILPIKKNAIISAEDYFIEEVTDKPIWVGSGHFDYSKYGRNKPIQTRVSKEDLIELIDERYIDSIKME